MAILGLRCSNSDYAYAVVDGSAASPKVIEEKVVAYPKDFPKPKLLRWFYQEMDGLFSKHQISRLVIKGAEGMASRGKPFVERTEFEAVAMLNAANHDVTRVSRKVKATIAKNLGMKGKAKYLDTQLNKSAIAGFDDRPDKLRDAILAAWSELK